MSGWQSTRRVEFAHVDGAGIVFYPRYVEMISSVIEQFFAEALDYPFDVMHLDERRGIPTAQIEIAFHAPSRLGEVLDFTVALTRIGTSSAGVATRALCRGRPRLTARQTIVRIDLDTGRPEPWPADLRARMARHHVPQPEETP